VGVSGRLLRPSRALLSSQEQVKVTHSHTHTHNEEQGKRKKFFDDASSLQDFLASSPHIKTAPNPAKRPVAAASPAPGDPLSVFIETYGCQMNASDSEIVRSVLLDAGHSMSDTLEDADVIVANTCAIRGEYCTTLHYAAHPCVCCNCVCCNLLVLVLGDDLVSFRRF
jgi:hypothetical protein